MAAPGPEAGGGNDVVLVDVAERVAVVTLNRPDQRNALNASLQRRIPEVIDALEADDAVDVIILTGADPAFCAGVDLKELGAGGVRGTWSCPATPARPDAPPHQAGHRGGQRGGDHRRLRAGPGL